MITYMYVVSFPMPSDPAGFSPRVSSGGGGGGRSPSKGGDGVPPLHRKNQGEDPEMLDLLRNQLEQLAMAKEAEVRVLRFVSSLRCCFCLRRVWLSFGGAGARVCSCYLFRGRYVCSVFGHPLLGATKPSAQPRGTETARVEIPPHRTALPDDRSSLLFAACA